MKSLALSLSRSNGPEERIDGVLVGGVGGSYFCGMEGSTVRQLYARMRPFNLLPNVRSIKFSDSTCDKARAVSGG